MQHDTNPSAYQGNQDSLKRCRRAAALQAAAPDLLAALKSLAFTLEHEGDSSVIAPAFRGYLLETTRAAIAKATT
jgi:hypothetical protein